MPSARVAYHGRIDDQFTYGRQRPKVEQQYLAEAIERCSPASRWRSPKPRPIGCLIGRVLEPDETSEVTYSNQIVRIFQERCVECHRPGEIGPFSLTSYEEVVGWAEMIREVVSEQRMPPWHADPEHGKFANDARLSDEEKQLIYDWVDAGAPQGDPRPICRRRASSSRAGRSASPTTSFYMPTSRYKVPATGRSAVSVLHGRSRLHGGQVDRKPPSAGPAIAAWCITSSSALAPPGEGRKNRRRLAFANGSPPRPPGAVR